MTLKRVRFSALIAGLFLLAPAQADEPFYAGKTISIVVGFGPGGGYDLYARLLSRFLGNHIPGKPTVIVQNMDGAGGVRAANHVYATAPKDGTVIAGVNQGATMFQLLGGKGAGEGGIIPVGGAVANAVASALRSFGVKPNILPLSPNRVWALVQDAKR